MAALITSPSGNSNLSLAGLKSANPLFVVPAPITDRTGMATLATSNPVIGGVNDPKWMDSGTIDGTRWNKRYPYQLIVVQLLPNGQVIPDPQHVFTLPIPPSDLTIGMPFAVEGTVTQGGYVEEHNGIAIRPISAAGSLGVIPLMPSMGDYVPQGGIAAVIFAGTIASFNQLKANGANLFGSATGSDSGLYPNPASSTTLPNELKATGYYQHRLLQGFLESYAALKKTAAGKNYALAFCTWKDEASYLVSEIDYQPTKNANSPLEYTYSLKMTAWRRVQITSSSQANVTALTNNRSTLQNVLAKIQAAMGVINSATNIVNSAIQDVTNAANSVIGYIKTAINAALTLEDIPASTLTQIAGVVANAASAYQTATQLAPSLASYAQSLRSICNGQFNQALQSWAAPLLLPTALPVLYGKAGVQEAGNTSSVFLVNTINSNPNSKIVYPKTPKFPPPPNQTPPPPIPLSAFTLPPGIQAAINAHIASLKRLTVTDLENCRTTIQGAVQFMTGQLGLDDPTYDATYGTQGPVQVRNPTDGDWQTLFALNDMLISMDALVIQVRPRDSKVTSIDYIAGLARGSGIAFNTPVSKFPVPFPYGATLESLANLYLGDPNRAIEIAALNGLRDPFVDEVGLNLTLLAPGNGNQVLVSSANNLYLNQAVWLTANGVLRTQRHILNIEVLDTTNVLLTLDGLPNLQQYSPAGGANLLTFLPDTVNSMQMIFIPSQLPLPPDNVTIHTTAVPGLNYSDPYLEVGGVDLLLNNCNDLIITPDGDQRLAVGLTNIIQQVRIVFNCPLGMLNQHPGFGFPLQAGQSIAEMDAAELLKAAQNIVLDFGVPMSISHISVMQGSPATTINMALDVGGSISKLLPLSFEFQG